MDMRASCWKAHCLVLLHQGVCQDTHRRGVAVTHAHCFDAWTAVRETFREPDSSRVEEPPTSLGRGGVFLLAFWYLTALL